MWYLLLYIIGVLICFSIYLYYFAIEHKHEKYLTLEYFQSNLFHHPGGDGEMFVAAIILWPIAVPALIGIGILVLIFLVLEWTLLKLSVWPYKLVNWIIKRSNKETTSHES